MTVVTINWIAILYSVIASMVIGMAWFGIFAGLWAEAQGKKKEDFKQGSQTVGYVLSVVSALVMAYILSHFIAYDGIANPSSTGMMLGVTTAFWAWLGFVAPLSAMNTAWEGRSWTLWAIDNGNYLVTLLVMGAILAGMM